MELGEKIWGVKINGSFCIYVEGIWGQDRAVYIYMDQMRIQWGKLSMIKNRVINQLSSIDSQEFADDFFFKRAGRRLSRIIIKENQNLELCWPNNYRILISAKDFSGFLLNLGM